MLKKFNRLFHLHKEKDKRTHFFAGVYLGSIILMAIEMFGIHGFWAYAMAVFMVAKIGFGFEYFSYITKIGHCDLWDGVATTLGALPLILYYLL